MDIYTCLANPHPSVVSHRFHSFLEVFGDKTNIPEDTQGRQMLLADTGRVPAAPSRSSRGGKVKPLAPWHWAGAGGAARRLPPSPVEQSRCPRSWHPHHTSAR